MGIFVRRGLSIRLAAVLLSGCSAGQTIPQASHLSALKLPMANFESIYDFGANPDDAKYPVASLIDVHGTLYGTTQYGGKYDDGTVFSMTPAGKERVIYSFQDDGSDGYQPVAGLTDVNGTLYGTTSLGGANSGGTFFSVTTSGKESVLHSFGYPGDGDTPAANLIVVKGLLYGTTAYSNAYPRNGGTVFSVTTSGKEKVVYAFDPSTGDGSAPRTALLDVNGLLYGTTTSGGRNDDGTVFTVTTSGKEKVIFGFDGSNGQSPAGTLVERKGMLYGTTAEGGAHSAGTAYSITLEGKQKLLHSFGATGTDGKLPYAGLTELNGLFYGTTGEGGTASGAAGTIFSMSASGSEKQLHGFGYADHAGELPLATLIDVGGKLYGTTEEGGPNFDGTAFVLTP
jgi:uncharacterized repeat protein (TIGR03803 family)